MTEMRVKILRDVAKNPNIIEVIKDGRKIKVEYDGDNLTFTGDRSQFPNIAEVLQMAFPYELESQSRPAWYDRNPKVVALGNNGTVGPHVLTTRATYIVPENRMAMIESIFLRLVRATAGAPAADVILYAEMRDDAGNYNRPLQVSLSLSENTPGNHSENSLGTTFTLNAGNGLWLRDIDSSTGGTVWIASHIKMMEFDA